jgi:colicin import membrane protein
MKTGLAISALVHAALLLWGLISFAARPLEAKPTDGMPIDLISDKEFSELAKGVKNAPKKDTPSPLVEKVAEPNKVEDAKPKVVEKKVVEATKTEPQPPPPAPEPKSKPEQAKPEKKEPPKVDQIAETLKKEEAKKKAEEKKQKAEQQKQHPAFDPNKIAALLDKRDPTRQASAGDTLSSPSLGYVGGSAAQLSQTEIDALRRRLAQCWSPPVGAADAGRIQVVLRVLFKPDGSLAGPPQLVAAPASSTLGPAMAESAKRALLTCQPFTMLRPEHYKQWQDMEITFDPRDMFGGG